MQDLAVSLTFVLRRCCTNPQHLHAAVTTDPFWTMACCHSGMEGGSHKQGGLVPNLKPRVTLLSPPQVTLMPKLQLRCRILQFRSRLFCGVAAPIHSIFMLLLPQIRFGPWHAATTPHRLACRRASSPYSVALVLFKDVATCSAIVPWRSPSACCTPSFCHHPKDIFAPSSSTNDLLV